MKYCMLLISLIFSGQVLAQDETPIRRAQLPEPVLAKNDDVKAFDQLVAKQRRANSVVRKKDQSRQKDPRYIRFQKYRPHAGKTQTGPNNLKFFKSRATINKGITGKVPDRAKPKEGRLGPELSKVKQMINKFDPELSKKRNYYKSVAGQKSIKILKPKVVTQRRNERRHVRAQRRFSDRQITKTKKHAQRFVKLDQHKDKKGKKVIDKKKKGKKPKPKKPKPKKPKPKK